MRSHLRRLVDPAPTDDKAWEKIRSGFCTQLVALDAHQCPHSGRTLIQHLVGTFDLLRSWKSPVHVCAAGMFHSIYGTNAFKASMLVVEDRDRVRTVIGENAERLVFLFCVAQRPRAFIECVDDLKIIDRFTGREHAVSARELQNLLSIECANLIEQGVGNDFVRELEGLPSRTRKRFLSEGVNGAIRDLHILKGEHTHMHKDPTHTAQGSEFDDKKYLLLKNIVSREILDIAWRYYRSYVTVQGYYETDDDTYSLDRYADAFGEALIPDVQEKIEACIGRKLIPTYSYARIYTTESRLTKHVDRGSCEISATMTVGYRNVDGLWPINIESDGVDLPIELDIGDAMLYKGMQVPHWRDSLPKGVWCQLFFHFVEANGSMADHQFDRRPRLGPVMGRKEGIL